MIGIDDKRLLHHNDLFKSFYLKEYGTKTFIITKVINRN